MNRGALLAAVVTAAVAVAVMAFFTLLNTGELTEAPDFTLTDVDGNTHNLTDYRGKVVVWT